MKKASGPFSQAALATAGATQTDAARYRWLRDHFLEVRAIGHGSSSLAITADDEACIGDKEDGKRLDDHLDRAMSADELWGAK